jgi:D12 class N6 adenine-specific DNA methyltransferase
MNEPLVQYKIAGLGFQNYRAPSGQLLKWIGNKQRFAEAIASHFPRRFNTFIEPFMGSGAVLATVAPTNGIGANVFRPLIDIWQMLKTDPDTAHRRSTSMSYWLPSRPPKPTGSMWP